MDCREFERRLEGAVDGNLSAAARRDLEQHAAACERCRELEELARIGTVADDGPCDAGLAEEVLARTSGPACGKAQELLVDFSEGSLDSLETELVRTHLDHCSGCEGLARTLAWVGDELPGMAELDPGPGFTAGVLRATVGRRRPGFMTKVRTWSAGLIWRPRFAMEAAYVGAAILWLLFGAGFSPFRDVPVRALELATLNPAPAMEASLSSIPDLIERPVNSGWKSWQTARGRVAGAVERKNLLTLASSAGRNGVRMIGGLLSGDLEKSRAHLQEMINDLKAIWHDLTETENNQINLKEA